MIENIFADNGKAIVQVSSNQVFSYSFSSDAYTISENPKNYRYATPEESDLLNKYLFNRSSGNSRFLTLEISRKQKILNILMENTELVEKASGGNDPVVISFKFSEDEDKETFLSRIAEEINNSLNQK